MPMKQKAPAMSLNATGASSRTAEAVRVAKTSIGFFAWPGLVEHLVRDQGVGGSNHLAPANLVNSLQAFSRAAKPTVDEFEAGSGFVCFAHKSGRLAPKV